MYTDNMYFCGENIKLNLVKVTRNDWIQMIGRKTKSYHNMSL